MSDYTPTTEKVVLPPLNEEVIKELALLGLDQMVVDVDDEKAEQFLAHVDRWLAEVKAQVWADGYTAGTHDWRTESLTTPNPYRQGEEHTHTKRSSFGDPYCKTCGIDLEGETE